ncbi:MAG: outer-membrane lipoprotein carrier protein LolA [bacterium]|nr:outer-membrane lipoprotein carrier protein LolA [bacterium]MDD5354206.1 outer-membrane lipoprotein carrier protein LolA [bacterium]MDD5756633.1 outer-membrane lipoprotein carrier protein LolA [bacterium]
MKTYSSKTILIFVIGLLFITGAALAADPTLTPQKIYENMQAQESKINDLQFTIKQVIELKAIKERQVIKGAIIYKKPDLLHVEYTSPTQQMIIANKDDFVMYILEQGKWRENVRQKVSNLIGKQWKSDYGLWSVGDLAKNYDAKATREGDKAVLWLEPKDKTYMFKMKIFVDTKNWLPVKTTWEDDNQLITSELLNVKMNTGVKDELFKFK